MAVDIGRSFEWKFGSGRNLNLRHSSVLPRPRKRIPREHGDFFVNSIIHVQSMGAISHMNQLYRENMRRLRSSRYNKQNGGKFTKSNTYKRHSGKLKAPELTFQERTRLRSQIEKRNQSQRKGFTIGVISGAVIAVVFSVWFITAINESVGIEAANADKNQQNQKQEYANYLSYGDEYMNQGEWYNAAFEYRTSLTFKPEGQEALQRLTYSLMRLCETEGRGCKEAQERLSEMEKSDFKPAVVNELRLRWEGINQPKR